MKRGKRLLALLLVLILSVSTVGCSKFAQQNQSASDTTSSKRITHEDVKKKVMSMYTDPDHIKVSDPGKIEGNTVFTYLDAFSKEEDFGLFLPEYNNLDELKDHYKRGGLGDVKVKKFLLNVLNKELEPIRNRRHEYEKDIPYVYEILKQGTKNAYEVAEQTLSEVKAAQKSNYFFLVQLINAQSEKYSG